ncbi:M15 family metallopeptidase [Algoriphagus sediminis]|uniref:D-alanyl-D-alanine dipeptidase n=1 Tax=Algoriphagus sediminis TaxID=3057113 RepID=A0ABT7YFA8_9BACT|nr:M15 family metallopeptidase [Algoriphagus sediminis]MDN3205005.1 M15 family metallopeptidase [Algoriphagus sediminis]
MRPYHYLIFLGLLSCRSPKSDQESFSQKVRQEAEPMVTSEEASVGTLEQTLIDQGLVNIQDVIPDIMVDLKYSTTDNFFGEDVYRDLTNAYLQKEVAQQLLEAQQYLKSINEDFTFMVYDGVRPASVQQILWDNLDKPDSLKPLYVADPKVGSLHNFGVAVDLTIFDMSADSVLDMGTGYDFFGYAAYPDREEQMLKEGVLTQKQINNREILREAMTKAGFTGITSEWWHFNAYSRKVAGEKFEIVK